MTTIQRRAVSRPAITCTTPSGQQVTVSVTAHEYRAQYEDGSWDDWHEDKRTLSCNGIAVTLLPDGRYQLQNSSRTVLAQKE